MNYYISSTIIFYYHFYNSFTTTIIVYYYFIFYPLLYLNEILYKFGKEESPFCFFTMEEPESQVHLFHSCTKINFLWTQLQHSFENALIIPPNTLLSTILGFTDHKVNWHLINYILLIFKYYVYKTRENGSLDLKVLKRKHS